jgi:hypothetical protein
MTESRPNLRTVFTGLMLGMLLAAVNQTIIAPAMPWIVGLAVLAAGFYLLTRMDRMTSYSTVVRNMILIRLGRGTGMQTFVLIVQNAGASR